MALLHILGGCLRSIYQLLLRPWQKDPAPSAALNQENTGSSSAVLPQGTLTNGVATDTDHSFSTSLNHSGTTQNGGSRISTSLRNRIFGNGPVNGTSSARHGRTTAPSGLPGSGSTSHQVFDHSPREPLHSSERSRSSGRHSSVPRSEQDRNRDADRRLSLSGDSQGRYLSPQLRPLTPLRRESSTNGAGDTAEHGNGSSCAPIQEDRPPSQEIASGVGDSAQAEAYTDVEGENGPSLEEEEDGQSRILDQDNDHVQWNRVGTAAGHRRSRNVTAPAAVGTIASQTRFHALAPEVEVGGIEQSQGENAPDDESKRPATR